MYLGVKNKKKIFFCFVKKPYTKTKYSGVTLRGQRNTERIPFAFKPSNPHC
jgi:hypothetical protein